MTENPDDIRRHLRAVPHDVVRRHARVIDTLPVDAEEPPTILLLLTDDLAEGIAEALEQRWDYGLRSLAIALRKVVEENRS